MIKLRLIKGLFILLTISNVFFVDAKQVELSRISTEEGLSVGYVTKIIQDVDGFIWIATEMGLNRYDGYEIYIIKGPNDVLERENVIELFSDKSGNIWIGTQESGIYSFNTRKGVFKHFQWPKSDSQKRKIHFSISITQQNNGHILLASKDKIYSLKDQDSLFTPLIDFEPILNDSDEIQDLYIHKSTLYILTSSSLYIYSFHNKKLKKIPLLNNKDEQGASGDVRAIIVANDTLWLASNQGLFSLPVKKIENYLADIGPVPVFNHELTELGVWSIVQQEQVLYLATSGGLFRFDTNNGDAKLLWTFSNSKYQLANNIIKNLLKDKNGNLWAVSVTDGVYYWRPSTQQFTNVFRQNNEFEQLSNNIVWSLAQGKINTLWIGTENGLNEFSLAQGTIQSYLVAKDLNQSISQMLIHYIFPDESDGLWLVTNVGLKYFDTVQRQLTPIKTNSDEDRKALTTGMTGPHLDSYGYLWFVSKKHYYKYHLKTGRLNKVDLSATGIGIESTHRFLGELPNKNTMLFSTVGKLWGIDLQTEKLKLIYQLPRNEKSFLFEVDSWVVDKNNILWLSFPGHSLTGLFMDDFDLAYELTSPENLDDDIIYGLLMDSDGDIWFSSHSGIYHLKIDGMFIEHYSVKDGLVNNEFNEGAYTKINDNLFAYGSVKGFTLFSPYELKHKDKNIPQVTISHISLLSPKVGRKNILPFTDSLILNHDDIGLKLSFSTLEYERQDETQYQFWLAGKDKWHFPLSKDNTVQFGKLTAGKYVFNVQARSPFTGNIGNIRKINISVRHAPWSSPLAYFCYFTVLIILLYIWQKNRVIHLQALLKAHQNMRDAHDEMHVAKQSAEQANKAKSIFLANISHELRTPMHSILSFSKLSLKILDKTLSNPQNDKLSRYASNINQSGKRLLRLINNLLDIEKLIAGKIEFSPQNIDFMKILTAALSEMEAYIMENKIHVVVDKICTETTVWAEEHLILQVLINLLSNAVKFSPEGGILTISIDSMKDGENKTFLEVSIKDQGPGVPENEFQAIFEQFVQSSNIKAGTSGTGLGLAISQHILKLHQGKIQVTNLPEKGACFSFVLAIKHNDDLS